MSVESAEDLTYLLADYGITVTKADSSTFVAIYDDEDEETDMGAESIIRSVPMLTCRTADVADIAEGSGLTIDGTDYQVRYRSDDGTGVTTITLQK